MQAQSGVTLHLISATSAGVWCSCPRVSASADAEDGGSSAAGEPGARRHSIETMERVPARRPSNASVEELGKRRSSKASVELGRRGSYAGSAASGERSRRGSAASDRGESGQLAYLPTRALPDARY